MSRSALLKVFSFFIIGWPLLLPTELRAVNPKSFDLVVYGATPSGVTTAIAAAREGLHVALVDPGHHVGGMVSGGLSSSDMGREEVIGGMAREFFERVGHYYGEAIEWRFEPHVAEEVFNEMLREAKVTTILDQRLREKTGVTKSENRIVAITLESGEMLRASVFADTTYEGDLMGQAGVTYTWGRESASEYGESYAGVRGRQRPDHHFNVRVSPYAADGSLLPEVSLGPKGRMGQGDKKVQAYGFRMCLTNDRDNEVPYPKPDNYNPYRYELLKRLIVALTEAKGRPPVMRELMIMSPLKGNKFDVNSFGGFSTDYIGASWGYPTADYKRQAEIWKDHYNYDAGFFYFLANDPSVPAPLRNEVNEYGLAKDEFIDNHNWPYQLYIREGRRMVGQYVMTQNDIQHDLTKPDSIGMGSYPSDSHHMQRVPTPGGEVENEGEMSEATEPYQIPYRMILPKNGETDNLLVPVCFSASHVAYSTIRMEPQYMIIGQAAGVAAAIAVRRSLPVGEIPIPELKKRLLEEGAVLSSSFTVQIPPQDRATEKESAAAVDIAWQTASAKFDKQRNEILETVLKESTIGPFQPDWQSLSHYEVPEWYKDAKFGIFIHWGVYSVPAFGNEWYPREMYIEGSDANKHQRSTYGPLTTLGYKDFIPMFKAEKFDPQVWARLFKAAGARYVVPVFEHHDGFAMYDSQLSDWTARKMGPKRDIDGELAAAIRAEGLHFGASSHRIEHDWFMEGGRKQDSDVNDPKYAAFYGPAHVREQAISDLLSEDWTYVSRPYAQDWVARNAEIVQKYHPELIFFDWWVGQPSVRTYLAEFAAYYYNESSKHGQVGIINYKLVDMEKHSAVLDIERGQTATILPSVWQTDTSVSNKSWGYIENDTFKSPDFIVHQLADVVSKNGNLLLNVGPRADGTIPDEVQRVLLDVGGWLKINGDAIYGTRPWTSFGEGPTETRAGSFHDTDSAQYTPQDFRFTTRGGDLYAIEMAWPANGEAVIGSLRKDIAGARHINRVTLLGYSKALDFQQRSDGLHIRVPAEAPGKYAYSFHIGFEDTTRE